MTERLIPDPLVPGAFRVQFGETAQSWVDPGRPDDLAFEYVQHLAMLLDETVLARPVDERVRVVHIGGGGLTLPRWVEWRRPRTAQVVCEPDSDLVAEVRRKIPLGKFSGIKIREVDGLSGVAAMAPAWADAIVVDAFDGAQVPGELATEEFFADVARVLRPGGVMAMNMTDHAPFEWARRCIAGIGRHFRHVVIGAEPAVLKGRRFGNLVCGASAQPLPTASLVKQAARQVFGYRLLAHKDATRFVSGAPPFDAAHPASSPAPSGRHHWFA